MDEPLVWYEGAGVSDRRWLIADERGSVVAVTNASGVATNINTYDEYGLPGASNIGRFQYAGQMWLAEANVYHNRARAYLPALGRFAQTDPVLYNGGMNLYAYVGNDPINFTDPLGLQEKEKIFEDTISPVTGTPMHYAATAWVGGSTAGIVGAAAGALREQAGDTIVVTAPRPPRPPIRPTRPSPDRCQ